MMFDDGDIVRFQRNRAYLAIVAHMDEDDESFENFIDEDDDPVFEDINDDAEFARALVRIAESLAIELGEATGRDPRAIIVERARKDGAPCN